MPTSKHDDPTPEPKAQAETPPPAPDVDPGLTEEQTAAIQTDAQSEANKMNKQAGVVPDANDDWRHPEPAPEPEAATSD